MTDQARSQRKVGFTLLPVATAALTGAVFVADTITQAHIVFASLYVAVILMAARFCRPRGVVLGATGCVALTVLSYILSVPVESRTASLTNTGISITAIAATAFLVLQGQSAEARVREQASLLDLTHDTIFVRGMDNVITYWNRGAEELYGWRSDEVLGKVTHELLHTKFPEPLTEIDHRLLLAGRWEGELIHTTRDGSPRRVASRWSLQRNDQGQPVAVLETNNDITERKRREEEIREHKHREAEITRLNQELAKRAAELQASNQELESFAYSVSHDLRAPLRHVVGFAELHQRHASALLDDKSRRYIQTILDSAKRMGTLIDDLLSFSRIGRAEARKTLVSLDQLAKDVVMEIGQERRGRDIAWKISALPVCYGDRSMLRLVFANLVSNAVKFTRVRKQAEIEIGCADVNNDEVEVFVRDNGAGFDMQYASKLFGVFQRLHLAEEFEGTGIGLAIVQRIIHRQGGKVRAEGAVDRGATFYFSLPKSQDAAERRTETS